ncbi:2644_t:CDS:2 [Ambispora leptoticha]|uniref:2644_t:CDS:1 n=1 Tax=Ambispora leptoticha TaxID=144679 RepID=A0A9N9FVZ7_9GLOM|nr:2644_t:CDS:2 [Ambispora leptoticha]
MSEAMSKFSVHNEINTNQKNYEDNEWSEFSTWDNTINEVEFTNVWQEFDPKEPEKEEEKPERTAINITGVLRDIADNVWSEVEVVASPTSIVSPNSLLAVRNSLDEGEKVLNEQSFIQKPEGKNSEKKPSLLTPPTSPPMIGTDNVDPENDNNVDNNEFGDFISQSSSKNVNTPNDSDNNEDEIDNDEEFGDFEFGQENNDTDDLQDTHIDVSSIDHSKLPQEVIHWIEFLGQIYPSSNTSDSQSLSKSIVLRELVNNANEYLNSEITLSSLVEPMINDDGIVRVSWRGSQTQRAYFENIFGFKKNKEDRTPIETTSDETTSNVPSPATVPIIPIYSKNMNENVTAMNTSEPRKSLNENSRESLTSSIESRRDSLLSIPELALSSTSTSPPTSPISPTSPCNSQPLHELAGLKFFNNSKPDRNQLFDAHYLKHLYHSSNNAGKGSQTSELADLITQDTTKSKALQDLQELTVALVSEIVSSPESSKKASKWAKSKFLLPIQPVTAKVSDSSLDTQSKPTDTARHKSLVINTKRDQPQKNEVTLNTMFSSDEFGDLVSADTTSNDIFDSAESSFSPQSPSISFEIMKPAISSKSQSKPITISSPTEIVQNTQEKNSGLDSLEFGEMISADESRSTKSNFANNTIKNSFSTISSHSHQSSVSSLTPAHSLFSTKNSTFKDFQELTAGLESKVATFSNSTQLRSKSASNSSPPINQKTSKSNNSERLYTSQINAELVSASELDTQTQSNSWFSTTGFSFLDSVKSQHDDFGALNSEPETTIV